MSLQWWPEKAAVRFVMGLMGHAFCIVGVLMATVLATLGLVLMSSACSVVLEESGSAAPS